MTSWIQSFNLKSVGSAIALAILLGMNLDKGVVPVMAQESAADPAVTAITKLRKTSDRWIEVQLGNQRLVAWEGNTTAMPFMGLIGIVALVRP
jgi:hypothetical protein